MLHFSLLLQPIQRPFSFLLILILLLRLNSVSMFTTERTRDKRTGAQTTTRRHDRQRRLSLGRRPTETTRPKNIHFLLASHFVVPLPSPSDKFHFIYTHTYRYNLKARPITIVRHPSLLLRPTRARLRLDTTRLKTHCFPPCSCLNCFLT